VPEEHKTDKAGFLKSAVQRLMAAGLGRIEIAESNPVTAELKFRIWNNFFAEMRHEQGTYCNCVEAYVNGAYEQLMHKTPETIKTRCIGKGDAYCEWQMKPTSSGDSG
jgi:predicted hydrocarbon binding protein